MEISAMQGEDVAVPDGVVSGAAGTGQEYEKQAVPVIVGTCTHTRARVVIGLGVLAPKFGKNLPEETRPGELQHVPADTGDPRAAGERAEPDPDSGFTEPDERIAERLGQKIARLEKRFDRIAERGRS
jgi:hypothetical protein